MPSQDSSATAIGKSERLLSGYDSDSEGGYSQRPQRQKSSRISLVLNILLGTACSILLFVVFRQRATFKNTFGCPLEQPGAPVIHTHGVEPPMLGPEFQKRTVLFQRNTSYMFRAEDAYPAWHSALHRARHGRVAFDSRPGEFYGVAGYHQLHCVWLMQQAITDAELGRKPDELQLDHMYHCAEYLRQSVMCYADPTLERRFEGILGPFSANNTHVCGNWEALMDWSDDHIYTGPFLNPTTKLPPK